MKNTIKEQLFVIVIILAVTGCSGPDAFEGVPDHISDMENLTVYSSSDIADADTVRLIPEQLFRDTEENPITAFGSVVIDDFGRLLIGDRQQRAIHLFLQDGHYLGKIGGDGDGPGEFRWVGGLDIHNNRLYAHDPNGSKINIFDLGTDAQNLPEYESAIVIGSDRWENFPESGFENPGFHTVRSDGFILLTSRTSPILYREYPDSIGVRKYYQWSGDHNEEPESIFEIVEPKFIAYQWSIIPPPFATRGIMTTSEDDLIYSGDTGDFLIKTQDAEGDYQSAFFYPFEKRELTRTDAVKSVEQHGELQDAVSSMPIPDTWPAIQQIRADNTGRIWVLVHAETDEINRWFVLEESGNLLAKFELPGGMSIANIDGDQLYTRETDEETGLQQIVKYRIEFGDGL